MPPVYLFKFNCDHHHVINKIDRTVRLFVNAAQRFQATERDQPFAAVADHQSFTSTPSSASTNVLIFSIASLGLDDESGCFPTVASFARFPLPSSAFLFRPPSVDDYQLDEFGGGSCWWIRFRIHSVGGRCYGSLSGSKYRRSQTQSQTARRRVGRRRFTIGRFIGNCNID